MHASQLLDKSSKELDDSLEGLACYLEDSDELDNILFIASQQYEQVFDEGTTGLGLSLYTSLSVPFYGRLLSRLLCS